MRTLIGVVVGALVCLASAEGRAQMPTREDVLERARRGVAVGATVGGGAAWNPELEQDAVDVEISFGLSLRKYKTLTIPDMGRMKELFEARAKAKIEARIEQHEREGKPPPTRDELEQIGRELALELRADLIRELDLAPKLVEKPSWAFDLEGQYFTRAGAGAVRATFGLGLWKVTLGPTAALIIGEDVGLTLGGELAMRFLPGKGPRSPNIDLFVRGEWGVAGVEGSVYTFGTRIMLDII